MDKSFELNPSQVQIGGNHSPDYFSENQDEEDTAVFQEQVLLYSPTTEL